MKKLKLFLITFLFVFTVGCKQDTNDSEQKIAELTTVTTSEDSAINDPPEEPTTVTTSEDSAINDSPEEPTTVTTSEDSVINDPPEEPTDLIPDLEPTLEPEITTPTVQYNLNPNWVKLESNSSSVLIYTHKEFIMHPLYYAFEVHKGKCKEFSFLFSSEELEKYFNYEMSPYLLNKIVICTSKTLNYDQYVSELESLPTTNFGSGDRWKHPKAFTKGNYTASIVINYIHKSLETEQIVLLYSIGGCRNFAGEQIYDSNNYQLCYLAFAFGCYQNANLDPDINFEAYYDKENSRLIIYGDDE